MLKFLFGNVCYNRRSSSSSSSSSHHFIFIFIFIFMFLCLFVVSLSSSFVFGAGLPNDASAVDLSTRPTDRQHYIDDGQQQHTNNSVSDER